MYYGKLIAGLIGLLSSGFPGLLIGILVGHYFDKALTSQTGRPSSQQRHLIEECFFKTAFLFMGRLAKTDGRVTETEIAHTEQLMARMGVRYDHRLRAIAYFKQGVKGQFNLHDELSVFNNLCARQPALARELLNYLLSLALADGELSAQEAALLREIASGIGMSAILFEQILHMVQAQSHFRRDSSSGANSGQHYQSNTMSAGSELTLAYQALGVKPSLSDIELKKAYRKLINENHPDKLMGQGVPEDMLKLATERSQEIQTAYDLIKKHRKANPA